MSDRPSASTFEELKLHPESFKAAFNLSRLYEQVGDREGQIGALEAVHSEQSGLCGRTLLPGQGVSGLRGQIRRGDRARAERARAGAAVRVCAARPLRPRGYLQSARPRADAAREVALGRALDSQLASRKR